MVAAGYAEEARTLAQTTVLGLGGFGQNDLPAPAFLAWGKADAVGTCLERGWPCSPRSPRRGCTPPAAPRRPRSRRSSTRGAGRLPPDRRVPRPLGPDAERLAAAFERRVLP